MKDMSEGWKHGPFSKNIISYVHDCCEAGEKRSGRYHIPDPGRELLQELVFLPANLSRVVIDAYREQCFTDITLGKRYAEQPAVLKAPFILMPPSAGSKQLNIILQQAAADMGIGYIQKNDGFFPAPSDEDRSFIIVNGAEVDDALIQKASGVFLHLPPINEKEAFKDDLQTLREKSGAPLGLVTQGGFAASARFAVEVQADMLLIDCGLKPGTRYASPAALTEAVFALRDMGKEDDLDLIVKGGFLDGGDAAKAIALGASAVVFSTGCDIAIMEDKNDTDDSPEASTTKIVYYMQAVLSELEMISRACGKYYSASLEPEDMRSLSLKTADMTKIALAGT